ncbi:hypothetical protein [Noviherbaspirillum sp.]|uniref:hypothetical protein n=1 Tax=Noviherbaspirillum sp. TaxID=1926288 RepID=UPI002D4F0A81|nr:hypothetical protein [Noviherbaspirillum sp.]HZW21303.1 hypothetical protein [Noviherbaspirillum sp.]
MQHSNHSSDVATSPLGIAWIRIAIAYLIAGVALGIVMGATHQFTMRPVHAHLNLVGWATGAIAGLIYLFFPLAAQSRLGKAHFVLHNAGVPVMMGALALMLAGNTAVLPVLIAGELATAAGVLVFAANLFVNIRVRREGPPHAAPAPRAVHAHGV